MAIDWNIALGSMDQSLEGILARRDLSKLQNLMLNVEREAQARKEFETQSAFQEKQLGENVALRRANQDATAAYREETKRARDEDDLRARANALKPGDRINKQTFDELGRFHAGSAFEEDPDKLGEFIFRRQEAERKLAEQEQNERFERERMKMEQERLKIAEQANKRAEDDQKRREAAEQRAKDKHVKTMNDLNKKLDTEVPVHLRPQFNKAVEDEMKNSAVPFYDFFSEAQGREEAIGKVYEAWKAKGLIKPTAIPPADDKNYQETPQQRAERLKKELLGGS